MKGILAKFIPGLNQTAEELRRSDPSHSENIATIEDALDHLPPERARFLAAFALLLGRIAYADAEISDNERRRMPKILQSELQMGSDQAKLVAALAIERTLVNSFENHIVLRELKAQTDMSKREAIIHALLALACEDDISQIEDKEIRSVADSFGFSHRQYVEIRTAYRDHLSVLKK